MPPKSAYTDEKEWIAALRDYFAGQALTSLIGAPDHVIEPARGDTNEQAYAKIAYLLADAMLKARGDQ